MLLSCRIFVHSGWQRVPGSLLGGVRQSRRGVRGGGGGGVAAVGLRRGVAVHRGGGRGRLTGQENCLVFDIFIILFDSPPSPLPLAYFQSSARPQQIHKVPTQHQASRYRKGVDKDSFILVNAALATRSLTLLLLRACSSIVL